jgi:hypothetical protein
LTWIQNVALADDRKRRVPRQCPLTIAQDRTDIAALAGGAKSAVNSTILWENESSRSTA